MKCDCQLGLRGGSICEDCKGTTLIQSKYEEIVEVEKRNLITKYFKSDKKKKK